MPITPIRSSWPKLKGTKRSTKFNSTRCTDNFGRSFQSILERDRSNQLRIYQTLGSISGLQWQVHFPLFVNATKIGDYVADFVYLDAKGGRIIEDAKGVLTDICRWKLAHMAAQGDPVELWPLRSGRGRK
jgi:hypothetical protein